MIPSPGKSPNELSIRPITTADAEPVARLCDELGYPVAADVVQRRIEGLLKLNHHIVLVGCIADLVVGWIDVSLSHHLQADTYGLIGGMVVASTYRNRGFGRRLLAEAERWLARQGINRVVVRSQIARESAHRFYLREGYSRIKTSAVFSKDLNRISATPSADKQA